MKNTVIINGRRYVCRIFDNGGKTIDRYTVCLKAYRVRGRLVYPYLAGSENPYICFGQHGESDHKIDGKHLGKRISFEDCPEMLRKWIRCELTGK